MVHIIWHFIFYKRLQKHTSASTWSPQRKWTLVHISSPVLVDMFLLSDSSATDRCSISLACSWASFRGIGEGALAVDTICYKHRLYHFDFTALQLFSRWTVGWKHQQLPQVMSRSGVRVHFPPGRPSWCDGTDGTGKFMEVPFVTGKKNRVWITNGNQLQIATGLWPCLSKPVFDTCTVFSCNKRRMMRDWCVNLCLYMSLCVQAWLLPMIRLATAPHFTRKAIDTWQINYILLHRCFGLSYQIWSNFSRICFENVLRCFWMWVGLAKCELLGQIWLRLFIITTFPILSRQHIDEIDPHWHEFEVNHVLGTGRPVLVKTAPRLQICWVCERYPFCYRLVSLIRSCGCVQNWQKGDIDLSC